MNPFKTVAEFFKGGRVECHAAGPAGRDLGARPGIALFAVALAMSGFAASGDAHAQSPQGIQLTRAQSVAMAQALEEMNRPAAQVQIEMDIKMGRSQRVVGPDGRSAAVQVGTVRTSGNAVTVIGNQAYYGDDASTTPYLVEDVHEGNRRRVDARVDDTRRMIRR